MAPRAGRRDAEPIHGLVASLSTEQLLEIVATAVDRHEDVERSVRLVAARADGDFTQLRAEVDRGLRTRRSLDYRASLTWAHAARPILTELDAARAPRPPQSWSSCSVGHVVKVIQHADDSSGLIGDLARDRPAVG